MTADARATTQAPVSEGAEPAGRRGRWRRLAGLVIDPPEEGPTLASRLVATPLYVWLLLAGLTFAMFSGWSHHLGLPTSLDRLLLPLAFILLLLDGTRPRQRTTPVHLLMVVFVTWIFVDMALRGMLDNQSALFALADRVVFPFLIFLAAPLVFTTPFRRRLLLVWLTVIGAYLGLTALLETFAPGLVMPPYIANPYLGSHVGRARGPMMSADAMGVACLALAVAAAALATRSRGILRVFAVSVCLLDVLGVVLSQTRAAWLAVVVCILAVLVLVPAARRWFPAAVVAGAAGAAGVAVAMPALGTQLTARFEAQGPVYDRLGSNDAALSLLADRPLTGIGWRRFYPYGSEWFRQSDAYPTNKVILEVHNVILSRAAELGLIAAAIFVLILVLGPGRCLWERTRQPGADPTSSEHRLWRVVGILVFLGWFISGLFGPMAVPFANLVSFLLCGVTAGSYLLLPPPPTSDLAGTPDPAKRTWS